MAQVTPLTALPADSDTTGAVQITGASLRCSVRATALTTLALIRMDPSGKWFRITDETGSPMQFTAAPGGDAGNLDVSFTLPAASSNEWYNLIADSTFAGYAEIDSLSAPPGPSGSVPTSRVLTPANGILLDGATAAVDLSADRTIGLGSVTFTKEANYTIAVGTSTTATTAGGNLAITAGVGATTGAGGNASLRGGVGGNDAVGGTLAVAGGAAGGGNRAGGAASVTGGAGAGSAAGGAVSSVGGAGGATGAGGAGSLTGGAGGATSGTGGAVAIAGGAGTNGNANGGAVTIDGGAKNGSGADGAISIGATAGAITLGKSTTILTFQSKQAAGAATNTIADPGNAGAIAVTASGVCALTSAGAETRTLAIPTFMGQEISLIADTYVGNIVVTSAQAINQAGNTIMTFGVVNDCITLKAMTIGGALRWRTIANDGVALS